MVKRYQSPPTKINDTEKKKSKRRKKRYPQAQIYGRQKRITEMAEVEEK